MESCITALFLGIQDTWFGEEYLWVQACGFLPGWYNGNRKSRGWSMDYSRGNGHSVEPRETVSPYRFSSEGFNLQAPLPDPPRNSLQATGKHNKSLDALTVSESTHDVHFTCKSENWNSHAPEYKSQLSRQLGKHIVKAFSSWKLEWFGCSVVCSIVWKSASAS